MAQRRKVLVLAALTLTFTTGCSGGGADPDPGPSVTEPGLNLFAPDLDGAIPQRTTVRADSVSTSYDTSAILVQAESTGADLCVQLAPFRMADDTCRVQGTHAVTSMEEMSGVALVRDGTLLYWHTLVTEADPDLLDRALSSLQEAPRARLEDLGNPAAGDSATTSEPTAAPDPIGPDQFRTGLALMTVRQLAGDIGPREGTSEAFDRATNLVTGRFQRLGYAVTRQRFKVPAGNSWGVPVPAGRSANIVATSTDFDAERPHLVIGAHLDTVPQAPGAEDNASGVGVMLAVAQAAATAETRLPVVFVAFGAEEPRGPTDDDHHYGSRHYVAGLSKAQRAGVRGMVSLDRVGVGSVVPIGSAGESDPVQRSLLAVARRIGVPTVADPEQRSSDHWSFVRAGLPGARIGSTPYAGYHSSADVPAVVSRRQLDRVGRILLAWLAPR